ncbi:hypothetical protein [Streptomyces sp. NPDC001068]|uniref:hypothetical protein n=1 Tax=Streptomyces sp. NPDC001068 TaxID=3364544 RepID=UPI003698813F
MILAHLDKQVADYETVGIYLRLQRDAVQAAILNADTAGMAPGAVAARSSRGQLLSSVSWAVCLVTLAVHRGGVMTGVEIAAGRMLAP